MATEKLNNLTPLVLLRLNDRENRNRRIQKRRIRPKGSIGNVFTVCIRTANQNQASFPPVGLHEISVLIQLALGHLLYHLTDVHSSQTPHMTMSSTRINVK